MEDFKKQYEDLCHMNNLIGSNIVIANNDMILEKHSYGYSNLENKTPSTEDTIYRIASISKTVGAIGLMMLVEAGKINLDNDISDYLGYLVRNPNYPNDIITVKMLTLQTSSILDGYDDENPLYDDIKKGYNGINGTNIEVTLKDLLTNTYSQYYTSKTFASYKPGTRWNYSNFGCGIMACIIECVIGETYVDYMENHLFKPLGLNASFKASHLQNQDRIADMYVRTNNGLKIFSKERFINSTLKEFPLGNNFRGPAGGLFITMKDLSIIMQVLLNYGTYKSIRILKRESVEFMYQMQWCGMTNEDYRAKGIQMKILNYLEGFPLRGHTGGAYGLSSYMFFSLKEQIGGCFVTNGIDSPNSELCRKNMFVKTQKMFLDKYASPRNQTVIVKQNEILLEERKIIEINLFLGNFIKATSFSDMMNTVGIYDEEKLNFTLTINNETYTIEDVILYKDTLYINFEETLKQFSILYQKKDDCYIIRY